MVIEHIALYVNDLEGAKDFFVSYLEASCNDGYYNQATGFKSYFLSFSNGARLEIMNKPSLQKIDREADFLGFHHLAFSVGSKEKVEELTYSLMEAGYQVKSGPRTTGDGYYESCIVGVEGNFIEITI